ncbi:UNVERIFIED_CONTAM: hypothetical protein Sradi_6782300 [Sesamum radiatum]|uniref:2Fe-2S ferredoxin-type domain-containing protein n=1 Tax=Sesamum radiatum TaxID=300843 RepID=A0AAW2JRL7_SESRA
MKKGQEPSTGKIETTSVEYVRPEFLPVALRPPELSSNHRSSAVSFPRRRPLSVSFASISPETSTAPPQKPEIQLEFLGPKPGDAVNRATAVSGEKLLRNIMQDNKIELYAAYGKVMNCGGGGSCGTCIVEVSTRERASIV